MELEKEKMDYSLLSMQELIDKLLERRHELEIIKLANELRLWDKGAYIDLDAVTDELVQHIDTLQQMAGICKELHRLINGYI